MSSRTERPHKEALLRFPLGILGFEDVNEYVLQSRGESPVWELCAADKDYPRFIVFAAESIAAGYRPELSRETMARLGAISGEELTYFAVAVISKDIGKTTVNLRSPVAVNFSAGLAAQVVLENDYPMRYPIFKEDGGLD